MKDFQAQLDENRQKVDVDQFDIPVRELLRMITEAELSIAPAYQRQFRWDVERESELMESLFLGLPVPPLFVATNADATWELVDGLQRVSSLVHFCGEMELIATHLEKTEPLKLTGLKKLTLFNGETFEDLPMPLRVTFARRTLRVTALSDKSQLDVRFDLFERLNRGGMVLTPQEVRACIYRGPLNDLVQELASDEDFVSLLKLQPSHASDGTKEEQVLKFLAYLENREEFDGAVADFLNDFMESNRNSDRIPAWRDLFRTIVKELTVIFAGKPIVRRGYGNTPLNQFEALMVAAGEVIRSGAHLSGDSAELMNDDELIKFSTKGTNTRSALRGRIERAITLLR